MERQSGTHGFTEPLSKCATASTKFISLYTLNQASEIFPKLLKAVLLHSVTELLRRNHLLLLCWVLETGTLVLTVMGKTSLEITQPPHLTVLDVFRQNCKVPREKASSPTLPDQFPSSTLAGRWWLVRVAHSTTAFHSLLKTPTRAGAGTNKKTLNKTDALPKSLAIVSTAAPRPQPSRELDCEVAPWDLPQALKMPRGCCCVDAGDLPASEIAPAIRIQLIQAQAERGLHSVCHTRLEQDRNDM